MPIVNTAHTTGQPAELVWRLLVDSEAFSTYMDEVRSVRIVANDGHRRICHWCVLLKGSELQWEEEEFIDHERRRIDFRQLRGDLAYFTGHWQVTETTAGTVVELQVDFDIGIPLMAEMLNPVAAKALEDNSLAILERLGDRAAQAPAQPTTAR